MICSPPPGRSSFPNRIIIGLWMNTRLLVLEVATKLVSCYFSFNILLSLPFYLFHEILVNFPRGFPRVGHRERLRPPLVSLDPEPILLFQWSRSYWTATILLTMKTGDPGPVSTYIGCLSLSDVFARCSSISERRTCSSTRRCFTTVSFRSPTGSVRIFPFPRRTCRTLDPWSTPAPVQKVPGPATTGDHLDFS